MQLTDIKQSIDLLPEQQAMDIILTTRKSRLTRKKKKKSSKKVKNPDLHLQAYAASLSPDDLEKFIKSLEDKI